MAEQATASSARPEPRSAGSAWRYREAIRTGRLLYRADNPPRIQLTTAIPRVLAQCIFFTLAGRLLSGRPGAEYAFTGIVAYAACTRTIVYVCDIPMTDKWSDSYYRLQAGAVPAWAIYLCRTLPYLTSGVLSSILVLAIGGPMLGLARLSLSLLPLLPFYILTACTSAALGLAVAGLAVGGSHDILFGNLAAYLILAASGIVTRYSAAARWLADLGAVLPLTHGLAAIRAAQAGRPWGHQAALETAVGACWLIAAVIVLKARDRAALSGRRSPRRPLLKRAPPR